MCLFKIGFLEVDAWSIKNQNSSQVLVLQKQDPTIGFTLHYTHVCDEAGVNRPTGLPVLEEYSNTITTWGSTIQNCVRALSL